MIESLRPTDKDRKIAELEGERDKWRKEFHIEAEKREELSDKYDKLQAQVEQYKEIAKWDWVQDQERRMKELRAALDDAEAEVERLRNTIAAHKLSGFDQMKKNDQRYRWLKQHYSTYGYDDRVTLDNDICCNHYSENWDEEIDAAMEKTTGAGE